MNLELAGKVAIVTGGGLEGGIGWAIVQELLREGASVVVGDLIIEDAYGPLVSGGRVIAEALDLTEPDGPERLVKLASSAFGRLDMLINNLGVSPFRQNGFDEVSDEQWRKTFEINLFAGIRAVRAALPLLLIRGGTIVNMCSALAHIATTQYPDYSATKAAILSLTLSLSEQYAGRGVRAIAISPGPVLTPQWTRPGGQFERIAHGANVDVQTARTVTAPQMLGLTIGRLVEPDEIAAAVAFACSGRAGAFTGKEWVIDAGNWKSL